MTQDELQAWLDDPESDKAGLGPGKESGHKVGPLLLIKLPEFTSVQIVDILSRNPSKDPEKYTDADKEVRCGLRA